MATSKGPMQAKGLAGAEAITKTLAAMQAAEAGADWVGPPRTPLIGQTDTPSNKEIIEYLAEGNDRSGSRVQRDISLNDKDGDILNNIVANEMVAALNKAGRTVASSSPSKGSVTTLTAERQAEAGLTGGLRKAAKRAAAIMYDRVKTMTTNDGSSADKVTKGYADWRNRNYGVNAAVVFFASGQLARALQAGNIIIRFNTSKIGKALKAFRSR